MQANDDLWERVARFKEQCDAICAEARQMVLANRALMRILEPTKESRCIEQNATATPAQTANVAEAFANRAGDLFQIICTDLDLALTFADMSQQAMDPDRKHRLARNAFLAYENALRIRVKIAIPADQKRDLDARLQRLQSKLGALTKSVQDHLRSKSRNNSRNNAKSFSAP